MIVTISMARPVCINAVPAKTNTISGYAMAAAKEEFFVKFRYWLVVGGIIILSACGITINRKTCVLVRPMDAAASFWPLSIPKIPALTFSAINVDVYSDQAKAKAINSGMIDTPPM